MRTEFAPAERATLESIEEQRQIVAGNLMLQQVLASLPQLVMVLNENRQVVGASRSMLDLLAVSDVARIAGQRPGELLGCDQARKGCGGCGTSEACGQCGAVRAVLGSQKGDRVAKECRIVANDGIAHWDLRVTASPLVLDEQPFTMVAVEDISHEKRRKALEQTFFHDLNNTLAVAVTCAGILKAEVTGEQLETATDLYDATLQIAADIRDHRDLLAAENGELDVRPTEFDCLEMIHRIRRRLSHLAVAGSRRVEVAHDTQPCRLISDESLVGRVVTNMAKNAIEACSPCEQVTMGCRREGDRIEFWVHNPSEIPRAAALQVFQRSFSTKGEGRGLGTYGMKLLTERYLGGTVRFTTSAEDGTTFYASYPIRRLAIVR